MAATAQRMLQSKLSIFSVNFLVCHTDASLYLVSFCDAAKVTGFRVRPQGFCPWNICAKAHYSHAKARNDGLRGFEKALTH